MQPSGTRKPVANEDAPEHHLTRYEEDDEFAPSPLITYEYLFYYPYYASCTSMFEATINQFDKECTGWWWKVRLGKVTHGIQVRQKIDKSVSCKR